MSSVVSSRPENLDLPRGTSETFTDEPHTAIRVPSCRPTPLIGSWADESWPLNSRQASEIVAEQALQAQRSSIVFEDDEGNVMMGDADASTNTNPFAQNESDVDDEETVNESMMMEAMSHAQNSTEEVSNGSPTHVAQSYMHDPYSINNCHTVLIRCTCEVCVPMLHQKTLAQSAFVESDEEGTDAETNEITENDSVSNQVSPAAPKAIDSASPMGSSKNHSFLAAPVEYRYQEETDYTMQQPQGQHEYPVYQENDEDWDLPTYGHGQAQAPPAPMSHQFPTGPAAQAANGFVTHTQLSSPPYMEQVTPTASPGQMNATPSSSASGLSHPPPTQRRTIAPGQAPEPANREITTFMPPPPPPRISTLVFEEEGGSVRNPSGVYYHLVMRWYSRVCDSQQYFVTNDHECPAPNKERFSFEEWCDEISGWWYTHFEHMQKKVQRQFPRRR